MDLIDFPQDKTTFPIKIILNSKIKISPIKTTAAESQRALQKPVVLINLNDTFPSRCSSPFPPISLCFSQPEVCLMHLQRQTQPRSKKNKPAWKLKKQIRTDIIEPLQKTKKKLLSEREPFKRHIHNYIAIRPSLHFSLSLLLAYDVNGIMRQMCVRIRQFLEPASRRAENRSALYSI